MEEQNTQSAEGAVESQITDAVTQGNPCDTLSITEEVTNTLVSTTSSDDVFKNALENCRLYAAKRPKEEWARQILRFCSEAGLTASPLR